MDEYRRVTLHRNGRCHFLMLATATVAFVSVTGAARAQTTLPQVTVTAPEEQKKPAPHKRAQRNPAPAPQPAVTQAPAPSAADQLTATNKAFDAARDNNLLPKTGANSFDFSRTVIESLPQGDNAPLDRVLLQAPGVAQDSAASGLLHIRNEHANVQYRINGVQLPDGVSGFSQLFDTSFIGSFSLITGALPAQYGLHTAALVDIQTRDSVFNNSGAISVYGGSQQWISPSVEYGGTSGKTQYFFTGRYTANDIGIENPLPSYYPIHDYTWQGRFFGYTSTQIDEWSRVSTIVGSSTIRFQIPNVIGAQVTGSPNPLVVNGINTFDSTQLNEQQYERNHFGVIAYQRSAGDVDMQLSYFTRYSSLHFVPDPLGDLLLNGVASDVFRSSYVNGLQGDAAYRLNEAHTLRAGFTASGEQTQVLNSSAVLGGGVDPDTGIPFQTDPSAPPFTVTDETGKFGGLAGVYIQDEWRMTDQLTLNAGLRFDQMWQFVDKNQVSPRVSLVYKPWESTAFHAGYARNFTPPEQVIATPANIALFNGTTAAPLNQQNSPVLPERSHVFDAGVDQKVLRGLDVGVDAYYKLATDLLDDGQFGQALVLDGFNYEKGRNAGLELKTKYVEGNFLAYGNLAWARQVGTNIVSNQFLFSQEDLDFIAHNWIYTDHAQLLTMSAGASYVWYGTKFSADLIYGYGLRTTVATPNDQHVPTYTQVNLGVSREFPGVNGKPATVRFDVVNALDSIYEIRNGSGVGVFAPQFGPRRGFFAGVSQKF
jgi:outer membrane receptor protein involved in Fe transport